jgi:hypothetical protein
MSKKQRNGEGENVGIAQIGVKNETKNKQFAMSKKSVR